MQITWLNLYLYSITTSWACSAWTSLEHYESDGATVFAPAIQHLTNLWHLNFTAYHVGADGTAALVAAIHHLMDITGLKFLDVDDQHAFKNVH